jgi:hypothetical protein
MVNNARDRLAHISQLLAEAARARELVLAATLPSRTDASDRRPAASRSAA